MPLYMFFFFFGGGGGGGGRRTLRTYYNISNLFLTTVGESSFLPAAPKGFVRIPSGSGPAVINTHGGPSLMLPLESAPVCKGGSNIPRIPHSYLGASVDSMPHAPPMIAAPPIRGLATDTEGKIQLHLLGTGNLPSPPLLLDPGDIQLPPPQVQNIM